MQHPASFLPDLIMELQKVQRKQAKIQLTPQGAEGEGKTHSLLLLTSRMADWSKIPVIDTEDMT